MVLILSQFGHMVLSTHIALGEYYWRFFQDSVLLSLNVTVMFNFHLVLDKSAGSSHSRWRRVLEKFGGVPVKMTSQKAGFP